MIAPQIFLSYKGTIMVLEGQQNLILVLFRLQQDLWDIEDTIPHLIRSKKDTKKMRPANNIDFPIECHQSILLHAHK